MPVYRFDPKTHTYTADGVRWPSVTEALKYTGLCFDYPDGDYAERGSRIHFACRQINLGLPVDDAIACIPDEWRETCRPFVLAYGEFMRDVQPRIIRTETILWAPDLRLAGTGDLKLQIGPHTGWLDIKTGTVPLTVGLQTALYDRMEYGNIPHPSDIGRSRWSLQLTAKASYKLTPCTQISDYHRALEAVARCWKEIEKEAA